MGDPNSDHSCWERPEDMDTPRNVYSINPARPGSDLAAEIAAAFAASSLAFKASDPSYSNLLLSTAHNVRKSLFLPIILLFCYALLSFLL